MAIKRTATHENPGVVLVKTSDGEFLRFVVTDRGPGPSFTLASTHGVLFAPNVGAPRPQYEWFRFKDPADPGGVDSLVLTFIFLANKNYTYTVELWNAGGKLSTVLDLAFEGAPTDHTAEQFTTVTA